jgi:signal transduction histidine kinase
VLVDDRVAEIQGGAGGQRAQGDRPLPAVVVAPGTHRLEFRYTALSWPAPEFVRFRYRLEGLDREWVEAGYRRAAHYNGLPPGDYRFRVIAANRDGVWYLAGATLLLHMKPFLWQTLWFQALLATTLAASVVLLVIWILHRRNHLRLERLERLHAVEQERARIAQDIHDDLGASLTQIALLSELAQKQIEEPQAARGHLDKIFTNSRKLVRATDEIVWALHPKNNTVELSLNFIIRSVQEFLRPAGVRCRLDVPAALPDAPMSSAARHHLYLAIKEALNNVIKHASATEVWLRLTFEGGVLVLAVEDNGKGFDREAVLAAAQRAGTSRRGNGLQSMEQRMRALGGSFEQTSEPGRGTVTRFRVPIHE